MSLTYRKKAEDFVGETFNNGRLEVVELLEKSKHSKYKVVCKVCSLDKELFPLGYFICGLSDLSAGKLPCGCSKRRNWNAYEFLIKAKRAAKQKGFIVHDYTEIFHGQNTKVKCECLKDGNIWESSLVNIMHNGACCKICRNKKLSALKRMSYEEVFTYCEKICKERNYTFLGFPDDYINQKSKLQYECPQHGVKFITFTDFKDKRNGCMDCARDCGVAPNLFGYYPKRKDDRDFLYLLNFNNEYLKIGRSFKLNTRFGQLKLQSNIVPTIISVWSGTHYDVFKTEQKIISEAKNKNLSHKDTTFKSIELLNVCSDQLVFDLIKTSNLKKENF